MQLPYHDRYAYSPIVDRPDYSLAGRKAAGGLSRPQHRTLRIRAGEGHLLTVAGAAPDPRTFAWRDYGNRVGVWRCLELFDELNLPAAHLINTAVFDYAPRIVDALKARGDEFIGHGRTNAERHSHMWEADERQFLQEIYDAIARASGNPPRGWMAPWMASTHHTPDLLKEVGFDFLMDWPADDQPLWMKTRGGSIMSIPYPIEINDSANSGEASLAGRIPRLHHWTIRGAAAAVGKTAAGMRHRIGTMIVGPPYRLRMLREALSISSAIRRRKRCGSPGRRPSTTIARPRCPRANFRRPWSAFRNDPFPVTALRSVDLETPDIGRSEQFYTSVWGLDLVTRHEGVTYCGPAAPIIMWWPCGRAIALRSGPSRFASIRMRNSRRSPPHRSSMAQRCSPAPSKIRRPDGGTVMAIRAPGGGVLRFVHGDMRHAAPSIRKPADETGACQSERDGCRWPGRIL